MVAGESTTPVLISYCGCLVDFAGCAFSYEEFARNEKFGGFSIICVVERREKPFSWKFAVSQAMTIT